MINAAAEFVEEVGNLKLKCATIVYVKKYGAPPTELKLQIGYSKVELDEFLGQLGFDYDHGYGSQYLEGTIWYEDGTWSERGEYDGSEWWEYKACPAIPDDLSPPQRTKEPA